MGSSARRFTRNPVAVVSALYLFLLTAIALGASIIWPDGSNLVDLDNNLAPPSRAYPLGTDELGRDLLARIVFGARLSLLLGVISVGIGAVGGVLLGLVAGYYGGLLDDVIMRLVDTLLAFPSVLLAILVVTVLGFGLQNAILAIAVAQLPIFIRLVRAIVLSLRTRDFIEAARVIGCADSRIIFRHILPNILGPVVVQVSVLFGFAILAASYLGFLGLGAQPPLPEWGTMLSKARLYLRTAPHIVTFPGLAIMFTVLAFNLVGDGIRDALDPRTLFAEARPRKQR